MTETAIQESKEQIMSAFEMLLKNYQKTDSKIATKEEEAAKEKNKHLLEKAANYTVNNIVNSMATLQLDFGNIIKEIGERLDTESNTLTELKKAISVETEKLAQLKQIRLVADALYILRQEHEEKIKTLENNIAQGKEALTKESEKHRKIWEKEESEFELKLTEETVLLTKLREKQEADFNYAKQIEIKMSMDEYEETKRSQERELTISNQDKEKIWQEREKQLKEEEKDFNSNQKKIEGFEEKLKEEYNKAKGDAIKEAEKEAKIKTDLVEKEWESNKQGFDFKIQSLEATIQRQNEQITEIINQLQNATNQAQNLALKAFQNPSNSTANNS